jgi:hypothetical protein
MLVYHYIGCVVMRVLFLVFRLLLCRAAVGAVVPADAAAAAFKLCVGLHKRGPMPD